MNSAMDTNHGHMLWRSRLSSALRTTLACAVVAAATLYSPTVIRQHLKFRAFAYMTAILIIEDATLGDSIKGALCALYATVLGLLPATLTLCMIHSNDISVATAVAAVALSSFAVVIFDSTALITKRIALGQIVIVYVTAFMDSRHGRPVINPVPVAASTAVGAIASVIALMFPYPRLACFQASQKSKLYTDIALERIRLVANGICADNSICAAAWAYQAKSLSRVCGKILQNLKLIQASLRWERTLFKFFASQNEESCERLQAIETPLRGMGLALASSSTSTPFRIPDQRLKDAIVGQTNQITSKLSKDRTNILDENLGFLQCIRPDNLHDLPSLFFLFCAELLHSVADPIPSSNSLQGSKIIPTTEDTANFDTKEEQPDKGRDFKGIICRFFGLNIEKLVVALKCSLSLSLAVLLSILFCSENAYWSGLTVAVAFTPFGDATFRSASARAHGTALGSVYGVIGSLISQNLMEVRLLVLLPWIIFSTFLHRSQMYGPVGGFAAMISATIILGRRDYGPPMIFAVQRLTETFIGLFCAVAFELLLQPKRASTLARARLSESLGLLRESLDMVATPTELIEREREIRKRLDELKKFIAAAEAEPNFWFLPFPTATYNKLHDSLAKIADLLLFMIHGVELLVPAIREAIREDLEHYRHLTVSSLKCFEDAIQIKSLPRLETDARSENDIEMGEGIRYCEHRCSLLDEEENEKIVDSFIRHAKNVTEMPDKRDSGESRSRAVLCLAALGFCSGGLMREMKEIEMEISELLQCENPCIHINLQKICCKLKHAPA